MRCTLSLLGALLAASLLASASTRATASAMDDDGFVSLFNGRDFTGWRIPGGPEGPWSVRDGVIHGDVRQAVRGDQTLWTEASYRNFVLKLDWRMWEAPFENHVPDILPDGTHRLDEQGKEIRIKVMDCDSGVYLRGFPKAQVNIWTWPIGSGEVYGYRTDSRQPPEVRAAVTPKKKADKPLGEWNTFVITLRGDRLGVVLNGVQVIENAQLPGIPDEGPLALQHHGGFNKETGKFTGPPSQVEFRNIAIKVLD
ncbi:MAG TPA: DUF1080 domain-containing protein [Gemmatales bacterium]|nr:DUF1080 domain-containing protein [Gemmatales bacterium]